MQTVSVALVGFGNVGKHFVRLLRDKREHLRQQYGLSLELESVMKADGGIVDAGGVDIDTLLAAVDGGKPPASCPGFRAEDRGCEGLRRSQALVMVEATPTNIKTGEPGLSHVRQAIEQGMHVVSLNKGPFVLAFSELSRRAAEKGVALKLSGATAAALPTADIATFCLAGVAISRILGILNGTTNYILTRMEDGLTFAEALREAQDMGVAERDPSLDVGGWDTASKLLILSNVALGLDLRLEDIEVEGITGITPSDIRAAKESGQVIKLLGQAERDGSGGKASVRPVALPRGHPLAAVTGTTKAVHFETDTMGSLTVIGGRSDPRAAAAAALKDIINLATSGQIQAPQRHLSPSALGMRKMPQPHL